jgi:ribosomal protein S18 acetylase RimI-like enzyme
VHLTVQNVRESRAMSNIKYRTCTSGDIEAVLELWTSSTQGGSTNTAEAIQTFLDFDAELFILAHDEDKLIGTVIAAWDGWRANFNRLAVHPEYRRHGIARELVKRSEELLRQRGAIRVNAAILVDSEQALDFWRSIGYTRNESVEPYSKTL